MNDPVLPPIEIRDPDLDGEAIVQYVELQVANRRTKGAYEPIRTTLSPDPLRPTRPDSFLTVVPDEFPGLREALAELIATGHLQEPGFTSPVPYIGPIIVAVRRLWNWMSTKWYVLPILRQQSDVNAFTARVISDLAQWHELDAHRLSQLEMRVAELEAELEAREES